MGDFGVSGLVAVLDLPPIFVKAGLEVWAAAKPAIVPAATAQLRTNLHLISKSP